MKTIVLSQKEFKKLQPFYLAQNIVSTEGCLYYLKDKNQWETQTKLLKRLYITDGELFGNKLNTLNYLIDASACISSSDFIMPEKLAIVNDEVVGFTENYIPSYNLGVVLNSQRFTNEQKIAYLKEVGNILEEMKNLRKNDNLRNFYLNDCNENNFVIRKSDNHVNAVDLDSCRIKSNNPFPSRYLSIFSPVAGLQPKYKLHTDFNNGCYFIADENSDLFCYNIMILNFIFKGQVNFMDLTEFYNYLDYLLTLGIDKELIDSFSKIYSYSDNINPKELLETLIPHLEKSSKKEYTKKV